MLEKRVLIIDAPQVPIIASQQDADQLFGEHSLLAQAAFAEQKADWLSSVAQRAALELLQRLGADHVVPIGGRKRQRAGDSSIILRHSGRGYIYSGQGWRVVKWCADLESGRVVYEALVKSLRQGAVALFFGGKIDQVKFAPRLRSKW